MPRLFETYIDVKKEGVQSVSVDLNPKSRWVGRSIKRYEDSRLLTGQGRYMDDLALGRVYHAAVVRSDHPHARILRVDVGRALKAPGVVSVLLPEDVRSMSKPFASALKIPMDHYATAVDKVRYVGEPIAVVVAENRYLAEDAAELVEVDCEPLPAVVDAEKASLAGAPLLHAAHGSNVVNHRSFLWGEPENAFAEADYVVKERLIFPRYTSMPLEGYVVIAEYASAEGAYSVWSNFQGPFTMHPVTAMALGVPMTKLRFLVPSDIGGGFGIKTSIFTSIVMVALAARKAGVRVKWVEDRHEHLVGSSAHADRVEYIEGAFRKDGTLLGIRKRLYDNVGAYLRAPEPACSYRTTGNTTGAYNVRHLEMEVFVVVTNKCPTGPNRGYGCQQLYFSLERLMDVAAGVLGMDPVEIRRKNLIGKDMFPYTTPTGGVYDSGDYHKVLDLVLRMGPYEKLLRDRDRARAQGRLYGLGLATVVDPSVTNIGYLTVAHTPAERAAPDYLPKSGSGESCMATVDAVGNVTVLMNTVPEGQGHETAIAQVVADELGVPPDKIRVVMEMDTATRNWTITSGSYSSRFAAVGLSAAVGAARRLRQKMCAIAAHCLEVDPADVQLDVQLDKSCFSVKGNPERSILFARVAGAAHWNQSALPSGIEPGLSVTYVHNFAQAAPPDAEDRVDSSSTYGFVADLVAVEVDPETGFVTIRKYVTVHDSGTLINPKIVEGQIYGGVLHGVGGVLYEGLVYGEDGHFFSSSLMDYICPTAVEAPRLEIGHVVTPSPISLLGSKGCGESGSMSAPAALANAVADAIGPAGAGPVTDLPLWPERIWEMLQSSSEGVEA